jgi:thymidylate kinase
MVGDSMQSSKNQGRVNIVSFSGIDGAGKSTQIEALRRYFSDRGLNVEQVRFWDDVARLKQIRETTGHKVFKGDKGVGSPDAPINRRDKNVQSWYMTCIRLFLYFVDAISLRSAVKKAMRSNADLVIFDRYAYDELANLSLSSRLIRFYVHCIMGIVPRPHISYLLDADPDQARARKPEYPLEFLRVNRASYRALSNLLGDISIVAAMPVEEVSHAVIGLALKYLDFHSPELLPGHSNNERVTEMKQPDRHHTRPAAS